MLRADIAILEKRQKALEKEIGEALTHAPTDDPMVANLKTRILYVKDEIDRLRHEAFVLYHWPLIYLSRALESSLAINSLLIFIAPDVQSHVRFGSTADMCSAPARSTFYDVSPCATVGESCAPMLRDFGCVVSSDIGGYHAAWD